MNSSPAAPDLTDGRVLLRATTDRDLDGIVERANDPESRRWATATTAPVGLDEARGTIERERRGWADGGERHWTIEVTGDDPVPYAGTIDLRPSRMAGAAWDVGLGLHPGARGMGVASAALRLATQWAFEQGVPRLYWTAALDNWPSRRVAWACGLTAQATLPDLLGGPDGPRDAVAYTLAAGEPMRPVHRWIVPPDLVGERVRLRQWREDDGPRLEEPSIPRSHWMPAGALLGPVTYSGWLTRRRGFIAAGASCDWCIADADTDRPLGDISLFSQGGPIGDDAEVGYQLAPSVRGRGIMREAARLALEFGLQTNDADGHATPTGLGLRRVHAETAADNEASNAVLARLGFRVCGRDREVDLLDDGTYGDGLHWELLAREVRG